MWSSLSAAGRVVRRRSKLEPRIVAVPVDGWQGLGTEKIVGGKECGRPFRLLAGAGDGEAS